MGAYLVEVWAGETSDRSHRNYHCNHGCDSAVDNFVCQAWQWY